MKRIAVFAFMVTWLAGPAFGAPAPAGWEQKFYDPHPAEDDLVLPMPCGGAMVFRPVDVPLAPGPLNDRPFVAGQAGTELGYSEYLHNATIAAPFAAPQPGARRYYIGKYDVTRDQFAAMSGTCPVPSLGGRIPQVMTGQPDAMAFAAHWTTWLLKNAREQLPHRGPALGYARLPTEDEWEFAARGGAKVSEEQFLAPTWPMPEGADRYILAGTRAAGGRAGQVGQKLANPLGLYDMLGNVDQMMLEPYRLNRVGRLHGQAGGTAVRGGNYTVSSPDAFRTAMRVEIPPFDPTSGEPTKLPTMGFRLVLSAPTAADLPEVEQARAAFAEVSGQRQQSANDPAAVIAALREQTADEGLRQGLDRLAARLASDQRERLDAANVALLAQLEAAALLAQNVWDFTNRANIQLALLRDLSQPDDQRVAREAAARNMAQADAWMDGYMRLVRQIATGPARDALPQQMLVLRQEVTARAQSTLLAFLPLVQEHAGALAAGRPFQRDAAKAQLVALTRAQVQGPR